MTWTVRLSTRGADAIVLNELKLVRKAEALRLAELMSNDDMVAVATKDVRPRNTRAPRPASKSALIQAALLERYACQAIPYGALTEIAMEFGVTRELVRVTANRAGITGRLHAADMKPTLLCGSCGVRPVIGKNSATCRECKFVTLPCAYCGAPVKRAAWMFTARAKRYGDKFTGEVFCDHACQGKKYGREYGWGNPEHPNRQQTHGTSGYQRGCRCDVCLTEGRAYARNLARKKKAATSD